MQEHDLASLLSRAKEAGLAHERELALLAGRAAIAKRVDAFDDDFDDDDEEDDGRVSAPDASTAAEEWFHYALHGALDDSESSACRRYVLLFEEQGEK